MYDHVLVGLSGEFFTYLVMDMKMFVTASNTCIFNGSNLIGSV